MTIIIDGYNLLKQREPREFITEEQRQKLIRLVWVYSQRKEHIMVIAFDGGPMPKPSREVHAGVTVLYAGWQLTADDIIKEYIEEHVSKELLLVSSDRQLNTFAAQHGVASIDSLAFWEIMEDTLKKERESATSKELIRNPLHPYTKALLNSIPHAGSRVRERLQPIRGVVPDPYSSIQGCPFHPRCNSFMPGKCDQAVPATTQVENGHTVRCFLYSDEVEK